MGPMIVELGVVAIRRTCENMQEIPRKKRSSRAITMIDTRYGSDDDDDDKPAE